MRAITFSLLFAFMVSSLSVEWILDLAYRHLLPQPASELKNKITLLNLAGKLIAKDLDHSINKEASIDEWESNESLSLTVLAIDDLLLPANLLQNLKQGKPLIVEREEQAFFYYYLPLSDQYLRLSSDNVFIEDKQHVQLILTIVFYLAISLLLTLWVYPFAKRLIFLRNAAKLFGQGKLSTRVEVGAVGGIRDLELEFNRMATQIETLMTDIKLLSGGVSHDLKTPLARLRFGIDAIQDESSESPNKYLSRLSDDTDEMIHLVDSMLEYTRIDIHSNSLETSAVRLDKLLSSYQHKQSRDDITVIVHLCDNPVSVNGHAVYLEMMFNNLISNAINYAKSKVTINLEKHSNHAIVSISDDGMGIPKEYLKDIFKPFFRTSSKTLVEHHEKYEKHYGLGLAIVKRIAEMHNASIECISPTILAKAPNGKHHGTQMRVAIPLL